MSALPDDALAAAQAADHVPDPAGGEQVGEPRRLFAVDPDHHPDRDTPDESDEMGEDQAGHAGRRAELAARLASVFTPGSGLYRDRQPSIAEEVRRAKRGAHLPAQGPLRTAATAYGYLAAANTAVADTWKWVVNHPARLAVVTALVSLAAAFPPTRFLLTVLLTPVVWLHAALV